MGTRWLAVVCAACIIAAEVSVASAAEVDVDASAQQQVVSDGGNAKAGKADSAKGQGGQKASTLEAIDQELLETESLIAAQEKKVNMLQVLRREYLSGKR